MSALDQAHEIHQEAMELAEAAFLADRRGEKAAAKKLYHQGFLRERDAANALISAFDVEPTRSVFYRSAATLALRCDELIAAERLAAQGLAGLAPSEIADELRAVVEDVTFMRHLATKGMAIDPESFQMSVWGEAVGPGRVAGHEFFTRYQDTERLVHRTAERKLKRPFRDAITSSKTFRKNLEVFVSVPRESSFAVTISVGVVEQAFLPEFKDRSPGAVVIQELLRCVNLFNEKQDEALRERIGDEDYYHNFVGLMGRIAPDGINIRGVGFASLSQGTPVRIGLTRRRDDPPTVSRPEKAKPRDAEDYAEVRGVLDIGNIVTVTDDDGRAHKVIVPSGYMGDVVRPLWEHRVIVRGHRKGKAIVLEGITESEE